MPRRLLIITALLLTTGFGLVALGCGDDDKDGGEEPTATATTAAVDATATAPSDETPSETPFAGSREPVVVPAGAMPDGIPRLVDVRAAAHEGFDRIVFEFDAPEPGFRVEYVEEALGCGTGEPEELEGAAFLQVKIQPADAHDDAGAPTFPQQELTPGLSSIVAARQTCDFEADVTWVVGLAEEVDFTAVSLLDPFRVVVDVGHPSERPPPTEP
jgi:hypothetical protein